MSKECMRVIEDFREQLNKSPFNRSCYEVTLDLVDMYRSLMFYYEKHQSTTTNENLIEVMTPEFQRSNNQWSLERKIKFVENILSGYRSTIILCSIDNDLMDECMILDGLQRLTALDDWMKNKFPVFGKYYHKDFENVPKRSPYTSVRLQLQIHQFKTIEETVQFYIDINKGITHSEEDILKAKNYLLTI